MTASLIVKVSAQGEVKTDASGVAFARLVYHRSLESEGELDADENASALLDTDPVVGTSRVSLNAGGSAETSVDDYASGTAITVRLEDHEGSIYFETQEQIPNAAAGNGSFSATAHYPAATLDDIAKTPAPDSAKLLVRSGTFARISKPNERFDSFELIAGCIVQADHAALKKLLSIDANNALERKTVALAPGSDRIAHLASLALHAADLKFDGAFSVACPLADNATGWVWLLSGPELLVGYMPETANELASLSTGIVVALPTVAPPARPVPIPAAPNGNDNEGENGKCPSITSPMDFDEEQLVGNPKTFSDDPGAYCRPFENPQRILGERRFHTVLRVDQPEIGGQSSIRPIEFPQLTTLVSPRLIAAPAPRQPTGFVNRLANGISSAFSIRPRLTGLASAGSLMRRRYVKKYSSGRKTVTASTPIDWEGDASIYQATTVARGHILEWRVQWRSNGYSLGDVAHTLTLAPRQKKRISKVSWERRERSVRRERSRADDRLEHELKRERDYSDAVEATLSEWSEGASRSRTSGRAGGAGFGFNGFVIGGGASRGKASSSAWQKGGREIKSSEEQSLRDAIRQYGESTRRYQATVVNEVTQEETVEGVAEVLRNPNYCHSLTVLYHEILRHLRVDTVLTGVRECVYVPFSIRPFDFDRAIRWRSSLARRLRRRSLGWALTYLEDVQDDFENSDIPEGKRADHPVQSMTGSIYIKLGIERPGDQAEDEFDEAVWNPFGYLLPFPVREVFEQIRQRDRQLRDQWFQQEIAPVMAVRWANELSLSVGNDPLEGVDFTLASTYSFNRVVRVDFTWSGSENQTVTRRQLEQLTVHANADLPVGSIGNTTRGSIRYHTSHFSRGVESDRGQRDLVDVTTGSPDLAGAELTFRVSRWEEQDLRQRIREAADELLMHLNEHVEYYHKVVWWSMDRDRLYMLLDGFQVGHGDGRSLASVVERRPIGILGNALVFRVAAGAFLGVGGFKEPEHTLNFYLDKDAPAEPIRISLPTAGLYAQAIMDPCPACEEHAGSVDWVLTDKDPELERLAPELLQSRRADPESTTPTQFQTPMINLQNAPEAPAPAGFAGILDALTKGDSFRDMAGLSGTQRNALEALKAASTLATEFGAKAVDLRKAELGTKSAPQKLASIKRAQQEGMIDEPEAKRQTQRVLEEMNSEPGSGKLTGEPVVRDMLDRASGTPHMPIEVSRQSSEGTEEVRVGGSYSSPGGGGVHLAQYNAPVGDMHMPRVFVRQSVGANGTNDPPDVTRVHNRLVELGYDWIGIGNNGAPNDAFIRLIRLFQGIIGNRAGNFGGNDGRVDPGHQTLRWLQASNAPRWEQLENGGANVGFVYNPSSHPDARHGTHWLLETIREAGAHYLDALGGNLGDHVAINVHHLSTEHGGFYDGHNSSHYNGLNVDVRLPRTVVQAGDPGNITRVQTTIHNNDYDQAATRRMLQAFQAQPLVSRVLFNDLVLVGEGLCQADNTGRHDNHIHVRIQPPAVGAIETEVVYAPPGTAVV